MTSGCETFLPAFKNLSNTKFTFTEPIHDMMYYYYLHHQEHETSCNYEPVHGRVHFSTLCCNAVLFFPARACILYMGLVFAY